MPTARLAGGPPRGRLRLEPERGREARQSGGPELAGRLVPVSPAPCPRAALIFARPAGPESVTVGSAEWVDWLTADSESPFRPGA